MFIGPEEPFLLGHASDGERFRRRKRGIEKIRFISTLSSSCSLIDEGGDKITASSPRRTKSKKGAVNFVDEVKRIAGSCPQRSEETKPVLSSKEPVALLKGTGCSPRSNRRKLPGSVESKHVHYQGSSNIMTRRESNAEKSKTGSSKRTKCEDGSHSASSQAKLTDTGEDDHVTNRPPGVKASKARGKKPLVEGKEVAEFENINVVIVFDLFLFHCFKLWMEHVHYQGSSNIMTRRESNAEKSKTGSSKRTKCEDGSHSASSQAKLTDTGEDDHVTNRPPGVKASKARGKKPLVEGKEVAEFENPIAEYEEALKKKLITELLSD
ncbi:hypothetical protein F2Q69_00003482 [Brassica cretica]|uniref:Uncharacterized protein n=1 Tax=Brassica cretica TaxID=69181 RepID=A0A8S9PBH3_BRACR|nr:hypothetical protein F2Q69_00003482 [Brassica cretica]